MKGKQGTVLYFFSAKIMDELSEGIQLAMLAEDLSIASPETRKKFDTLLDRLSHPNMSILTQRKLLHGLLSEQAEGERIDRALRPTKDNRVPVFTVAFPAPECDEFDDSPETTV